MANPDYSIALAKLLPFAKSGISTALGDSFSKVKVYSFSLIDYEDAIAVWANIDLSKTLSISVPGLSGFSLIIGDGDEEGTDLELWLYPEFKFALSNINVSLTFPSKWLKPVTRKSDGTYTTVPASGGKPAQVAVSVKDIYFAVDGSGNIDFSLFDDSVSLGFNYPFMIGDSGVVVEATTITLCTDSGSATSKIPGGGFGVLIDKASVHLPGGLSSSLIPSDLTLKDFAVGSGGFSGTIKSSWTGNKNTKLFGMEVGLKSVSLSFIQNSLTGTAIKASLKIPYFDKTVEVDIGFDLNGNLSISLGSQTNNICELKIDGVLKVSVNTLSFERKNGGCYFHIGGDLKLLAGGFNWPGFKINDLMIDSDGNVSIDGGWLNLPSQYSVDFQGFQMEISKIGFGKEDDGSKWIGFSGGIKLVDGLPMGASVEGLRIKWTPSGSTSVSFNGIVVTFEIPGALSFKGAVSYVDDTTQGKQYFKGDIKLKLISLGLSIDAVLLVGRNTELSYNYFFIYLDTQLPVGIPLWSSGLSLYGLAGLFANNMEPNKTAKEKWYDGWYKNSPIGVTDPETKWTDEKGSIAVGAGVTVGTVVDNGFSFSCRALLVVVIPGPIIILEGRAQVLSERAELGASGDSPLKALMVIDGRAGTFQFNIEASYKLPEDSGMILDVYASAEAYFESTDKWHFYLGQKDPREKRVRAHIVQLLEANAYFMLDPDKVQFGACVTYCYGWFFGPVEAGLKAWIEGGAMISWKPAHFYGYLWLHGGLHLKVFGFGFSLGATAKIEVQTPTPYAVLLALSVEIDLPWFLPDIDVELKIKWEKEADPPVPLPLKEISVGHLKVTDTWSVKKVPDYDTKNDGFVDVSHTTHDQKKALAAAPVVPLDGRVVLGFSRPIDDLLGLSGAPSKTKSETVGKKDLRFQLVALILEKQPKGATKWTCVAQHSISPPVKAGNLFGKWQATGGGSGPVATKLYLWSKNAFEYLNAGGRSWADWFVDKNPGYPCTPVKTPVAVCVDFDSLSVGNVWPLVLLHHGLLFITDQTTKIISYASSALGTKHAAQLNLGQTSLTICFPKPVAEVRAYTDWGTATVTPYYQGTPTGMAVTGSGMIRVRETAIDRVDIQGIETLLLRICYLTVQARADGLAQKKSNQGLQAMVEAWKGTGYLFEPDTGYRLAVGTRVLCAAKGTQPSNTGKWKKLKDITEYGYFRTQGPPGLISLKPRSQGGRTYAHPLTDLALYLKSPGRVIPGDEQRPRSGEAPRPVYRGYDIGLEFNENYVEQMYRSAGRDLALNVFDNNRQHVRDVRGRLIILPNRWDKARTLALTFKDDYWIYTVNRSTCAVIDTQKISRSNTVGIGDRGMVLRPQTLHEVRVQPLLLHDDFNCDDLSAWSKPYDEGDKEGKSQWSQKNESVNGKKHYYLIQTGNHYGEDDGTGKWPGTYITRGEAGWTDYRLTVGLQSSDDDGIGVMFRFKDANTYYRFSMDKYRCYRMLIKKSVGTVTVLAKDAVPYEMKRDYVVTIEAIGGRLRVYIDGVKLFDVKDATPLKTGKIGLYCWANTGARFNDVRVDDLSTKAAVVHRFKLITSRFVDFAHHLHSFQDTAWDLILKSPLTATQLTKIESLAKTAKAKGLSCAAMQTDELYGLYDLKKPAASGRVDVSLIASGTNRYGLMLESPEPICWKRVDIPKVRRADRYLPPTVPPKNVKVIAAALPPEKPTVDYDAGKEYVDVMLRDTLNPSGHRIQHLRRPGSIEPIVKERILLEDDFTRGTGQWKTVDEGNISVPSKWAVSGGRLTQTANIHGEIANTADKPGTYALNGKDSWTDYRVSVKLRSDDDDGIGVMFRYTDAKNYYRFSMDSQRKYRRLIKKVNGSVTILWHDNESFETGREYTVTIDVFGDRITVYLDETRLIALPDTSLTAGKIGLYCWGNQGAGFFWVSVRELPALADQLFSDDFTLSKLIGWTTVDEGTTGSSNWSAGSGVLKQSGTIQGEVTDTADKPGTYITAGKTSWDDYRFSVRCQSDDDNAFGVMFRYTDQNNYYRFSMDRALAYRRLIRKSNGTITVLWEDSAVYDKGREYIIAVDTFGSLIDISINGVPVVHVNDNSTAAPSGGSIGLYCWGNKAARFTDVQVCRSVPAEKSLPIDDFSSWRIVDEGGPAQPAAWKVSGGALTHTAETHGGSLNPKAWLKPGTHIVHGDENWRDYRLSVQLTSKGEYGIGVMARYQDADNYYRFSMDQRLGYRRLVKVVNGSVELIWQDGVKYTTGKTYSVNMTVSGSTISVSLDGKTICSVPDSSIDQGKIGLYCWGNAAASFDNLTVTVEQMGDVTLLKDTFDTFDTSVWSTVSLTPSSLSPDWNIVGGELYHGNTHPGTAVTAGSIHWSPYRFSVRIRTDDRGTTGICFGYYNNDNTFYFMTDRNRSRLIHRRSGGTDVLWQGAETLSPNDWHELTVELKTNHITLYLDGAELIELPGIGGEGKVGLCAWGADNVQFDDVKVTRRALTTVTLLSDDFSTGMNGWQVIDRGEPSAPANWTYKNGVITQTAPTHGGSLLPKKAAKPGTHAVFGSKKWTDYRLAVQLRTDTEFGIGVMFRYSDTNNYYRFSMNRRLGYRRLIKKVNGTVSVLWEDTKVIETGRDYLLTLDVFGDLLQVHIDGIRVCSISDASLLCGAVGLYCWGNNGARFENVKVLAPQFVDFYRFEDELSFPAGTVFRIHTGSGYTKPKPGELIEQRCVAKFLRPGRILLHYAGETLRIVNATGIAEHRRSLLPATAYKDVTVSMLRTSDETVACLFFPGNGKEAGPVPKGHYRLEFTFHRDISGKASREPLLRRAGSSVPEKAIIECSAYELIAGTP